MSRNALLLALLLVLAPAPGLSQRDPAPASPEASGSDAPQVGLDQLLKLPSTIDYSLERRGGFTAGEWRARFDEIRTALDEEREGLEKAEEDLERIAGSSDAWLVGPPIPGASGAASEAPLDFRIRQTINRHREEIEHLERQLRELEVEANLAGVPEAWRE